MKHLNKIASAFCAAALGMLALTSCEGGELYKVNAPDWVAAKVDSIAEANKPEELVGMMDDYYPIGNTDFTAGFFTLGKTYIVPAGVKWNAEFTLTVNPDNKYYKNFYIVLNDYNGALGDEYGVIRFDNDPSKNSEWNTVGTEIDRSLVSGTFTNSSDADEIDPSVQKFNGKITLTVNRAEGGLFIEMRNGDLVKTYNQKTSFPSTGSEKDLACRIGVEGSFVQFLTTNIEPIGGCTSKEDKQPVSMVLNNVPSEIQQGIELEEAMKGVTATVTYEQDVVAEIEAGDLVFNSIPDIADPGKKTLVVMYAKTTNGAAAVKPIMASAEFEVVPSADKMTSLVLKTAPKITTYCLPAVSDLPEHPIFREGLELTATYEGGYTSSYNLDSLEYSGIKYQPGKQTITLTAKNGKTVTFDVNVVESPITVHKMAEKDLGTEDCTAGWWTVFTEDVKVPAGKTYQIDFTNYCGANNWNNFVVILRKSDEAKTEYGVYRADNYAWRYAINPVPGAIYSGGQKDWGKWLAAMKGAKCTAYITNSNDGTADIQIVMKGTDGNTYYQYYLGSNEIDPNDLNFSFTVDGSYLVF